jgi:choline dehydrogenase-like flavoprotein
MNKQSFKQIRSLKSHGYLNFMAYSKAQGPLRHFGLTLLLNISFFKWSTSVPIVSSLAKSVQGLLLGYIVEAETSNLSGQIADQSPPIALNFEVNPKLPPDDLYDYIIVGSGPGSAIAAQKIHSAFNVLVIEQGGSPRTPPCRHHSLEHVRNDFYKGGQEVAISPWLPQFAQAAVLGGGSEVNSGLYHDLPDYLIADFLNATGLSREKFLRSQEQIRGLLRISQMDVKSENSPIARGAQGLGIEFQNIPRWRTYKENSEFIQHGMIDVVWSHLSQKENFQFKLDTRVDKVNADRSDRIKVSCTTPAGKSVEYFAKNLIVAAGAIQTPRLLAQSGLIPWKSTNFQWHPMVRTIIKTSPTDLGLHDVDPFQAWTADRKFKFGSAVSTPGLLAMNLGRKPEPDELPKLRSVYGSFVSSGRGGLIPHTNFPYYFPSPGDKKNLQEVRALLEKLVDSGGASFANPEQRVKRGVSTVHVFGTLPINSGVFLEGTSRLKTDPRIQVSDGSLLPFGPGVNPQGVIMSLCNAVITG